MNIFVSCSEDPKENSSISQTITEIGNFLVEHDYDLVFNGTHYSKAIKRLTSIVVKNKKCRIIATGCKAHFKEFHHVTHTHAFHFDNVCDKKNGHLNLAHIMIFFPGNISALDMLMTAIETKQKFEHNISIIIANIDGFYDHFLNMIARSTHDNKFLEKENDELFTVTTSPEETLQVLSRVTSY